MRSSFNRTVLLIFAPLLLLTGILGFVLPTTVSLTSGAPAYNVFHIVSGTVGLLLAVKRNRRSILAFNLGFGIIDLYQAAANIGHLFPERYFRWTSVDDVLHVAIGTILVSVALFALRSEKAGDGT